MREYGQIQTSYWTHPDIRSISIEAKLIGAYLLTCSHANGLGCFRMPKGYISIDTGIPSVTVSEGLHELSQNGFLEYCERSEYVLIPDFLRWNPIVNPNSAKARVKEFDSIPKSSAVYPNLINALTTYGRYFDDEFSGKIKTIEEGFRKGSDTVSEGVRDNKNKNRTRTEQDHEQEQNKKPMVGSGEKFKAAAIELLNKLNEIAGKNYQVNKTNLTPIQARLEQGHSFEDLVDVIRMKTEEWKDDPKMSKFLRPETLFGDKKCNGYVGSLNEWRGNAEDYSWTNDGANVIDGEVVND